MYRGDAKIANLVGKHLQTKEKPEWERDDRSGE